MTYKKWGHLQRETEQGPKYDAYLLDRSRDIRQNHWTMKYRSQWPTNRMRSLTGSDWTSILSMMPSYLIGSEIQGKNHWTMKYRSQWHTKSMRSLTVWNWTNSKRFLSNRFSQRYMAKSLDHVIQVKARCGSSTEMTWCRSKCMPSIMLLVLIVIE